MLTSHKAPGLNLKLRFYPLPASKKESDNTEEEKKAELFKSCKGALKPSNEIFSEEETFGETVADTLSCFKASRKLLLRRNDVLFDLEMGAFKGCTSSSHSA